MLQTSQGSSWDMLGRVVFEWQEREVQGSSGLGMFWASNKWMLRLWEHGEPPSRKGLLRPVRGEVSKGEKLGWRGVHVRKGQWLAQCPQMLKWGDNLVFWSSFPEPIPCTLPDTVPPGSHWLNHPIYFLHLISQENHLIYSFSSRVWTPSGERTLTKFVCGCIIPGL